MENTPSAAVSFEKGKSYSLRNSRCVWKYKGKTKKGHEFLNTTTGVSTLFPKGPKNMEKCAPRPAKGGRNTRRRRRSTLGRR